ncbi:MAG: copper homeostasis protein CutC [Flavobacteriaceae bacterium]|nr:copper homeostasis protein CutC [Flavobacteriaceae bacterium]
MNFELCIDSLDGLRLANKYGFKRVELCSALTVGGLTPSLGLIEQCVAISKVEIHVMIRHKEGGFDYTEEDVNLMKTDIEMVKSAGVQGVVFGILNKDLQISDLNKALVVFAKSLDLEVTFHRAFDLVKDYKSSINKIINFNFDRLLTSGLKSKAIEGLDVIKFLQNNYGNKIQIMAGSGLNTSNALEIAETGIQHIHFTARKINQDNTDIFLGAHSYIDEDKVINILKLF